MLRCINTEKNEKFAFCLNKTAFVFLFVVCQLNGQSKITMMNTKLSVPELENKQLENCLLSIADKIDSQEQKILNLRKEIEVRDTIIEELKAQNTNAKMDSTVIADLKLQEGKFLKDLELIDSKIKQMESDAKKTSANYQSLTETEGKLRELKDITAKLEQSVIDQERYTSKDCLIIDNLPIFDQQWPMIDNVLKFVEQFLGFTVNFADIKACHPLPRKLNQAIPPVIVKFVYFDQKNQIYFRRVQLGNRTHYNPSNNRPVFIRERLSKHDLKLKMYAENNMNMVTTTFNSQVRVFIRTEGNKTTSKPVNTFDDIHKLENIAIKKRPGRRSEGPNGQYQGERQTSNTNPRNFFLDRQKRGLEVSPEGMLFTPSSKLMNFNRTPPMNQN